MTIRNTNASEQKRRAGRMGGLARIALHGNPGTRAGRSKGGFHSLKTHRLRKTNFKTLQKIRRPRESGEFAEFVGIIAGDGHLGRYQTVITTNAETDIAHAMYVKGLAERLFKVQTYTRQYSNAKAVAVVISSKSVCELLRQQGIPIGRKQVAGIRVPRWIRENPMYTRRYIRGLFDTDGCVFQDNHKIGTRIYSNLGLAFANSDQHILEFFFHALSALGLHPTQTSKHRIFLRRRQEIEAYFKVVGTSNPKHRERFLAFRQK